jgi:hypothetical protein
MTSDHNVKTLGDELHDLAADLAPSASGARDRARRGIARHTRNRRAALASGAAVVVIAAVTVIAVDRDPSAARRPAGTTRSVASTTAPSTSTAPTTAAPGQPTPGSPVLASVPPIGDLTALPSSYTKTFPWGTGPGEVAFHTPQGEGASGGPVAFSADSGGTIALLDHSAGRLVRLQNGADSSDPIAVSPAVTAAVFDSRGNIIVATVGDVAVYLPSRVLQNDFGALSTTAIMRLQVVGNLVFSVSENSQYTLLLADDGTGYAPAHRDVEPMQVIITPDRHAVTMSGLHGDTQYEIASADAIRAVDTERVLSDGTLAFVLTLDSGVGTDPGPTTYVVGRIDAEGHARYQTVSATAGYLVNGPELVLNNDGLAVMGSTTAGGATVAYYPFT